MPVVNKEQPLVSIIIPAYNSEDWLPATLRSALGQTYQNIEVIVVDDGSTDTTPDIVREYMEDDTRLKLVTQENQGVGAARNHGIREATGAFLAPLDGDDLWSPYKIEKQLSCLLEARQRGEPVGMVYCWSEIIDEQGNIIRKGVPRQGQQGNVFEQLLIDNFMGNGSTPLVDADLVRQVGGYQEGDASGCEDWTLYLMIAYECRVAAVEEYLVGYRQFETSMSHHPLKMLHAHEVMIDTLRAKYPNIKPANLRDSRTAMQLWMLYRARLFSSGFFRLLGELFKNDLFFWIRRATLHKLYWMFYVRVYRFRMQSKGGGLNGAAFESA